MNNKRYQILIEPDALQDIQNAIDYYDEELAGLGKKFEQALNKLFISLERSPFYAIRYSEVHCLPLKKFPFMIHFTVDEINLQVVIRAVLHTALSPGKWKR